VEAAPGYAPMQQLDATDLDDSMTQARLQARRFSVENDLSHVSRILQSGPRKNEPLARFRTSV